MQNTSGLTCLPVCVLVGLIINVGGPADVRARIVISVEWPCAPAEERGGCSQRGFEETRETSAHRGEEGGEGVHVYCTSYN